MTYRVSIFLTLQIALLALALSSQASVSGQSSGFVFPKNFAKIITEPSGQVNTLAYDTRLRLQKKTDAGGVIDYGYDLADKLKTVTEGSAIISRNYDARNRLVSFTSADGDLIQYGYDANNNLTKLTYPDGKVVNYAYNARNLLVSVTDWGGRVTSYQYDRLGRLVGITRPNGTAAVLAHDAASQLSFIKESKGGRLFSYLAFQYDAAGQVKSRLRAPLLNSNFRQPLFQATYDADNRLATLNGQNITHDADGNMTHGPIQGSVGVPPAFINLSYNSRNQLTNADGLSYTYDAEGRRRTITDATGTTRDTVDPSSKLLVRHHPNGTKTFYVYGLGLLYEVDQAEKTKTYHFDQVGSTIARTDDTGKVIGTAEYSAYGLTAFSKGDMATPFLYNGQAGVQTDANGLLHMRARYYSPYLMRFLNSDPIGFSGGMNWFAYADGNPISLSDPFGLCAQGNLCTGGYGTGSKYASNEAQKLGTVTEIAYGFTPFGIIADLLDMGSSALSGDGAGFGMAAAGLLPLGDLAKLRKLSNVAGGGDEMVDVYRGVHNGHPDIPNAYKGQANPVGGHSDPYAHNRGDNFSEFTSWSTDRNVAVDHATQWGTTGGVLLEQTVPRSSLTPSLDQLLESEVLRTGPVTGATPIILKR